MGIFKNASELSKVMFGSPIADFNDFLRTDYNYDKTKGHFLESLIQETDENSENIRYFSFKTKKEINDLLEDYKILIKEWERLDLAQKYFAPNLARKTQDEIVDKIFKKQRSLNEEKKLYDKPNTSNISYYTVPAIFFDISDCTARVIKQNVGYYVYENQTKLSIDISKQFSKTDTKVDTEIEILEQKLEKLKKIAELKAEIAKLEER